MQLQLNHEGEQYIIGMPLQDRPGIFSQCIVDACLLDWVPRDEGNIASFQSPEQAQRAIRDLKANSLLREDDNIQIYKVNIVRLDKSG